MSPPEIDFGSNLLKISETLGFEVKLWKTLFCESLDLIWPSAKPFFDNHILWNLSTWIHRKFCCHGLKTEFGIQFTRGLINQEVSRRYWVSLNLDRSTGIKHVSRSAVSFFLEQFLEYLCVFNNITCLSTSRYFWTH